MGPESLSDEMDRLRDSLPGCRLIAFADLAAGLILCVSAARRPPQEELDALCAAAVAMLGEGPAPAAGRAPDQGPRSDEDRIDEAVRLGRDETSLFLRSPAEPDEALCCLGTAEADVEAMLAGGRALLARIGAAA